MAISRSRDSKTASLFYNPPDIKPPSVIAKEKALAQVARNAENWFNKARIEARRILKVQSQRGGNFTGEEIRHFIEEEVGRPHHHNAWGALISALIKDGVIRPTGLYAAMEDKKSHARRTPEYWVL